MNGEKRNAHGILVGRPEGKRSLGRHVLVAKVKGKVFPVLK
jgi:hypothetical protein